jgi:dienelactone hydrolase
MLWRGLAVAVIGSLAAAASAAAFDPATEARNFSKTTERAAIYSSPEGQLLLRRVGLANALASRQAQLADPERSFSANLCASGEDGCAGDPRLYDWGPKGHGLVEPVLWTARNGATISGHVWATRSGPAQRPGVVITNGSLQADEQMYWYAAQVLAKAGYVVLTWDPQGQGRSDVPGEGPDANEGVPAQSDGRPFYDGTVDALDFFLSTPRHPFTPRPSCETGTSHAPKHQRRVAAGLNSAHNPFAHLLDRGRIGLAGHSYGAAGVSYVGQWDPRVKAIVAWDNLGAPDPGVGLGARPCPSDPEARRPAPITRPALGLSADYGLIATPYTADPDPLAKSAQSLEYSRAGVDTGQLVIRGGTHYEFSFIPNPAFGATLRGADLTAWYTTAWFDRYVKGDPTADARLLTARWRDDFSFYYRSRLDIDGFTCEDLRSGCPGMVPGDGEYSYLSLATSPDAGTG